MKAQLGILCGLHFFGILHFKPGVRWRRVRLNGTVVWAGDVAVAADESRRSDGMVVLDVDGGEWETGLAAAC